MERTNFEISRSIKTYIVWLQILTWNTQILKQYAFSANSDHEWVILELFDSSFPIPKAYISTPKIAVFCAVQLADR
jgi:hypothetical protein